MKTQHGRDLTPEEMAEMLEEFASSHNSDVARAAFVSQLVFGTHRSVQQAVMRYVVTVIEKYSTLERGDYDQRNEASVNLSKKMIAATGDQYDRFLPRV